MKVENEKTRYSDIELKEFKDLLLEKLSSAKEELNALATSLSSPNANGTDDTAGTYKTLEDGSATLDNIDTKVPGAIKVGTEPAPGSSAGRRARTWASPTGRRSPSAWPP